MKDLILATLKRFLRVFVSTGIASIGMVIVANPLTNLDLKSLETWVALLLTAFISGGLAGLDKAIRFQE